jgi:hypothetical protein
MARLSKRSTGTVGDARRPRLALRLTVAVALLASAAVPTFAADDDGSVGVASTAALNLNVTQARVGQQVQVAASSTGYTPSVTSGPSGGRVTYRVDISIYPSGGSAGSATVLRGPSTDGCATTNGGAIVTGSDCAFTIPVLAAGAYRVRATDQQNTNVWGEADLTILAPALTVSPGTAGTPVRVGGSVAVATSSNFVPSVSTTATFDGVAIAGWSCTVGSAGALPTSCAFTVPVKASGTYEFAVSDGTNTGSVSVHIAAPAVTFTPTSGRIGASVTVATSSNFAPGASTTATFDGSTIAGWSCTVESSGALPTSCGFTVPAVASGAYDVVISDGTNSATRSFTVNAPAVTFTPTSGQVGASVTVATSSNFALGASTTATFGGSTIAGWSCTVESSGALPTSCGFTVPAVASGAYDVVISDGTNSATRSFTVNAPTMTLSSTSGTAGTAVNVTAAAGFAPSTATSATFGGTAIAGWSCTSTASGSLPSTCGFTVPARDPIVNPYAVVVSDGTNSASVSFSFRTPVPILIDGGASASRTRGTSVTLTVDPAASFAGVSNTTQVPVSFLTASPTETALRASALVPTAAPARPEVTGDVRRQVTVSWTGAGGAVDVYRNGTKVATAVGGDPAASHVDVFVVPTSTFAATYTYVVCESGTTDCSDEVVSMTANVFDGCKWNNQGRIANGCTVITPYSEDGGFRVRIVGTPGEDVGNDPVLATAAPLPPRDLTITPAGQTLVLSWLPSVHDAELATSTGGYQIIVTSGISGSWTPVDVPATGGVESEAFDPVTGRYTWEIDTGRSTGRICLRVDARAAYGSGVPALGSPDCGQPLALRSVLTQLSCETVYYTNDTTCTVQVTDGKKTGTVAPLGIVTVARQAAARPGVFVAGGSTAASTTCTLASAGTDSAGRALSTCTVTYRGGEPGRHDLAMAYAADRTADRHQDRAGNGSAGLRPRPPADDPEPSAVPGAQTLVVGWAASPDDGFLVASTASGAGYRLTVAMPASGPGLFEDTVLTSPASEDPTYSEEVDTLDVAIQVCVDIETVIDGLSSDDAPDDDTDDENRRVVCGTPGLREVTLDVDCEVVFVDDVSRCTLTVIDRKNPAKSDTSTVQPEGVGTWSKGTDLPGSFVPVEVPEGGASAQSGDTAECVLESAGTIPDGSVSGLAVSTCQVDYHSARVGWHDLEVDFEGDAVRRSYDGDDEDGWLPIHGSDTPGVSRAGFDYVVTPFGSLASTGTVAVKAGAILPIVFRLTTAQGEPVTDFRLPSVPAARAPVHLYRVERSCDVAPADGQRESSVSPLDLRTALAGKSGLQNLGAGWYQLNVATEKSLANRCVAYVLGLGDASTPAQPDLLAGSTMPSDSNARVQLVRDAGVARQFVFVRFTR